MTDEDRAEVHILVDNLLAMDELAGPPDQLSPAWVIRLAREVRQLRQDIETRTHELHLAERDLCDRDGFAKALVATPSDSEARITELEAALVDLVMIAKSAARRGLLSERDTDRLRELERLVPQ